MAHVHSFTTVGLESQASAFCYTRNGVIKYLALLPQKNEVNNVTEVFRDARGRPLPTAAEAVEEFRQLDPKPVLDEEPEDGSCAMYGGFIQRCWIHTHPKHLAYMSPTDILQLFSLHQQNPNSFGIVISPRGKGPKVLCVRLTREGRNEIQALFHEEGARGLNLIDAAAAVHLKIAVSDKVFYRQIPFQLSHAQEDSTLVVDLRGEDEVLGQLKGFILSGRPSREWIAV